MQNKSTVFHLLSIVVVAIALIPFTVIAGGRVEVDELNDRFATETFVPSAGGFVKMVMTQDGSIELALLQARNLEPNHEYEVKVTVQPEDCGFDPACITVVTSLTQTTDSGGHIKLMNLDLGSVPPGTYRVDIFVTHTHPTVPGSGDTGVFLSGLLDRDPLLACQPAPVVTVE